MDQNKNNSQNEFLWTLLANPANDANAHADNLQRLVNEFPQSGILQAMLAHASDEKNLHRASVYFNPKALYKLINAPSSFIGVLNEKITIQNRISSKKYHTEENTYSTPIAADNIIVQQPTEEPAAELLLTENNHVVNPATFDGPIETHHPAEVNEGVADTVAPEAEATLPSTSTETTIAYEAVSAVEPVEHIHENKFSEAADHAEPVSGYTFSEPVEPVEHIDIPEEKQVTEISAESSFADHQAPALQEEHAIEEETFDEITAIEDFTTGDTVVTAAEHEEVNSAAVEETVVEEIPAQIESNSFASEEDKLIASGIASSNYFMFDKAFGEQKPVDEEEAEPAQPDTIHDEPKANTELHEQEMTRYHDEKMPYTFMWWLDKTRKEHEGIYQPYLAPKAPYLNTNGRAKKPADELQQQYYENIFHITSIEELEKNTAPKAPEANLELKRKELDIIERFIHEEPTIRPQSSDKLDNENKAKKSSEDRDELVTETLAAIYTDQMLYHKAIASYKKLMLKFPEKSRYFAGKIEQLEKKTN